MMATKGAVWGELVWFGPVTAPRSLMSVIYPPLQMMRSLFPIHDWKCGLIARKVSIPVQANGFDLTHRCLSTSYLSVSGALC